MGFYDVLAEKRKDNDALRACVTETVQKLVDSDTSVKQPAMLLGRIQSGKTRAFIGVIASAFDQGYDFAIVLTKGTKALSSQTERRLSSDFAEFVRDDEIQIHDILSFPKNFTPWELKQKLIIIAKKEINNMRRVIEALTKTYPDLSGKRLLIIDDEADFASVSFKKGEGGSVELGKIGSKIDELRTKVAASDFLQVTATPYSLYLQPSDHDLPSDSVFKPKRPAFTVLLPAHPAYVGGEFFFVESQDENSIAYCIFKEVPTEERDALKKEDGRRLKLEDVLTAKNSAVLRSAIINFIVGGVIRRQQQAANGERPVKYSFVAHTERTKVSHGWQERVIRTMYEALSREAAANSALFRSLLGAAYVDLKQCSDTSNKFPSEGAVRAGVSEALRDGYVMIATVNSETDVKELLDDEGQLKLRSPFNIFIGGQILDRGITVNKLIGFYYGRNPQKFQQDTVLQHSRMYGARDRADLAVTRFYTTRYIYETMRRIHEFDSALRDAFERGTNDAGIVFLRKDSSSKILPCSPNKLLRSSTTTLGPLKRLLPIGFQTRAKSYITRSVADVDADLGRFGARGASDADPVLVDLADAQKLVDKIFSTLEFDKEQFDSAGFRACLEYLSKNGDSESERGKVWLLVRRGRDIARMRSDGRPSNAPDTKQEMAVAEEYAAHAPMLMLFKESGSEDRGWRGAEFWWPVLVAPQGAHPVIFAAETV